MALMLVVLTAVSATFASGTHSETNVAKRIRAESDARAALSRMRDDLHCAFAVQSISQNAVSASNPSGLGFTLSLTEYFNTCTSVDQNPGSGSRVFLAWCTVPSGSDPNVFDLYRHNSTCDNTGTLVASHIVKPATGWPAVDPSATGPGGSGLPTSSNGNIWPTTPTCQLGYLKTQSVDIAVNPDAINTPANIYELKDQIALRNSTRCGTGAGTLAGPALAITAPVSSQKNTAITPSATLTGSSGDTSPITFFYWNQPAAPSDCTTGGTTVGTASAAGDGTFTSSLSLTPTTAGDHIWWYATISADSNNAAANSVCGSGMPMTTVTNGPAHPTLTMVAPATATKNVAIAPAAIGGTLAGSSGAVTGGLTFYVIQQAAAPTTCPGAMTNVGTASPTADGTWNPATGYTPSSSTNKLWWYAAFAGDANDVATATTCGAGMASTTVGLNTPTLTVTGPATGTKNIAIAPASITSTLAGSVGGTTATITVSVYGPSASAPVTCTGAGWTTVGTSTPAGNGSYNPGGGYTPSSVGTYWWYSSYAGDANNNPTASACGAGMSSTVVGLPDTFAVTNVPTQTVGTAFNVTLTATLSGGGTDTAYTGVHTITWSGAANGPNGTAPVYPAAVTFVNGVGTASITVYKAVSTTLIANEASSGITGTSNAFNVNKGAASALAYVTTAAGTTIACPTGTVTVGAGGSITVFVALLDVGGNLVANGASARTITISKGAGGGNAPSPGTLTVNGSANPGVTSGSSLLKLPNGNPADTTYTATTFGLTSVSCIVAK